MRSRRLGIVIVAVLMVVVLGVALYPVYKAQARLGLDLQGGVMVRLEAPEGTASEDVDGALSIIKTRIDSLGVAEPEVRKEGDRRISVELAGIENPDDAIALIGTTAKLEFVRVDTGEVILSGAQLIEAKGYMNQQTVLPSEQFGVSLKFNQEGTASFAQASQELVSKYVERDPNRAIAIVLDGKVLSTPTIRESILNGEAAISGNFTSFTEASDLALLLKSGALPVELKIIEQKAVGPQLGPDAIAKSIIAALIGSVLLGLFMVIIYRGPGVIAIISLVLYAILLAGSLILIRSTITLPVIAAFLLSVGMAVDANVLIYERIKEELRDKKSIRVAVDAGFKKAFATILDSNMTTLIAGVILILLGSGSVRGFAITLSIGILISLFTAITFTKLLLKNLVEARVIESTKFFGV